MTVSSRAARRSLTQRHESSRGCRHLHVLDASRSSITHAALGPSPTAAYRLGPAIAGRVWLMMMTSRAILIYIRPRRKIGPKKNPQKNHTDAAAIGGPNNRWTPKPTPIRTSQGTGCTAVARNKGPRCYAPTQLRSQRIELATPITQKMKWIVFIAACPRSCHFCYVRPSAQIRWLRKNGWRFTVNGLKEPIVAVAESERNLVSGKGMTRHHEPNFGALNG